MNTKSTENDASNNTPRIAHIIPHMFSQLSDGGRVKTATIATALAQFGELHLFSLDDDTPESQESFRVEHINLPFGGTATLHRYKNLPLLTGRFKKTILKFKGYLNGFPWSMAPSSPRTQALWLGIRSFKPDIVIADDTRWAPIAFFIQAKLRAVHTHNMESELHAQLATVCLQNANILSAEAKMRKEVEKKIFPKMDQVWGVRSEDLEAYAAMGVMKNRLFLTPNVVPPAAFLPNPTPGERGIGFFFGSLDYIPNQLAIEELLLIAPALITHDSSFKILVAGRSIDPTLLKRIESTTGISHLGFIEDLSPIIRKVSAILIPLNSGGGTKLKVIHGLASGKPVLTTKKGAEGLGLQNGVHAILCNSSAEFIEAAISVLENPSSFHEMALKGQSLAQQYFSLDSLSSKVNLALGKGINKLT